MRRADSLLILRIFHHYPSMAATAAELATRGMLLLDNGQLKYCLRSLANQHALRAPLLCSICYGTCRRRRMEGNDREDMSRRRTTSPTFRTSCLNHTFIQILSDFWQENGIIRYARPSPPAIPLPPRCLQSDHRRPLGSNMLSTRWKCSQQGRHRLPTLQCHCC